MFSKLLQNKESSHQFHWNKGIGIVSQLQNPTGTPKSMSK